MAALPVGGPASLLDLVNPARWVVPEGAREDPRAAPFVSAVVPRAGLKFADRGAAPPLDSCRREVKGTRCNRECSARKNKTITAVRFGIPASQDFCSRGTAREEGSSGGTLRNPLTPEPLRKSFLGA